MSASLPQTRRSLHAALPLLFLLLLGSCSAFTCRGCSGFAPSITQGGLVRDWNILESDTNTALDNYLMIGRTHHLRFGGYLQQKFPSVRVPGMSLDPDFPFGSTWTEADEALLAFLDYLLDEDEFGPFFLGFYGQSDLWQADGDSLSNLGDDVRGLLVRYDDLSGRLDSLTEGQERQALSPFYQGLWEQRIRVNAGLDDLDLVAGYLDSVKENGQRFNLAMMDLDGLHSEADAFRLSLNSDEKIGLIESSRRHQTGWDLFSRVTGAEMEVFGAIRDVYTLGAQLPSFDDDIGQDDSPSVPIDQLNMRYDDLFNLHMHTWEVSDYFGAGPVLGMESPKGSCMNYINLAPTDCATSNGRYNIDMSEAAVYWDDMGLKIRYSYFDDSDISLAFTEGTGQVPQGMFAQTGINANFDTHPLEEYQLYQGIGGATHFFWYDYFDHTAWATEVEGNFQQRFVDETGDTPGVEVMRTPNGSYLFGLDWQVLDVVDIDDLTAITVETFNGTRVEQVVIVCEEARLWPLNYKIEY